MDLRTIGRILHSPLFFIATCYNCAQIQSYFTAELEKKVYFKAELKNDTQKPRYTGFENKITFIPVSSYRNLQDCVLETLQRSKGLSKDVYHRLSLKR